jgi:hypothetical protein
VADPEYFLEPGELRAAFTEFEVIHSALVTVKGERSGEMKLVEQLVARLPKSKVKNG